MVLNPPVERSREYLLELLQAQIAIVTSLPTVAVPTETGAQLALRSETTHTSLLSRLPNNGSELARSYALIERNVQDVLRYSWQWLQYQALWDLQTDTIVGRIGDDLKTWQVSECSVVESVSEGESSFFVFSFLFPIISY